MVRRILLCGVIWLGLASMGSASVSVTNGLEQRFALSPAERVEGHILLKNHADQPMRVMAYVRDYRVDLAGQHFPEANSHERSNATWIEFTPREHVLPAQAQGRIDFVLQAPENREAGTYWSVLMVEGIREGEQDSARDPGVYVENRFRTAVRLQTHLHGPYEPGLNFLERRLIHSPQGRIFRLDMENAGDIELRLHLWAELFTANGRSLGRFELGQVGLLPMAQRSIDWDLPELGAGSYELLLVADHLQEHIFAAQYQLHLRPP